MFGRNKRYGKMTKAEIDAEQTRLQKLLEYTFIAQVVILILWLITAAAEAYFHG